MRLFVNQPFVCLGNGKSYTPGQEISDATEVQAILAEEGCHYVTKLADVPIPAEKSAKATK